MPNNFNQTVNLREKSSAREKREEDFYDSYEEKKQDLKKISKPQVKQVNEGFAKKATIMLAVVLIMFTVYWIFFNKERPESKQEVRWYKIELVNGKIYYGQISDLSANPVVITNVYYDYDQINGNGKEVDEIGETRLKKFGDKIHGQSGALSVYQIQIEKLPELSKDSIIVQSILEDLEKLGQDSDVLEYEK